MAAPQRVAVGDSVVPAVDTGSPLSTPARVVPTSDRVTSDRIVPPSRCWGGEILLPSDPYAALGTCAEISCTSDEVLQLTAVAVVTGEGRQVVVHPDGVGRFVLAHRHLRFVGHNTAAVFWEIERHLRTRGEHEALAAWWAVVGGDRLHDVGLLDALVRLARDDSPPTPRPLAEVVREYAGVGGAVTDPDRAHSVELGADGASGAERLAAANAVATRRAYEGLRKEAAALADPFTRAGNVQPDARRRFGPLSEAVQVKKAVALAAVTRAGMRIDRDRVRSVSAELRARLNSAVVRLRAVCPELYRIDAHGRLLNGPSGAPVLRAEVLVAQLAAIRRELGAGVGVCPPTTDGTTSTKLAVWSAYRDRHPFVRDWLETEEATNLLRHLAPLTGDAVHPEYAVLVRTGRTACSGPNVQQVPHAGNLRSVFVPSPGHLLLAVDYTFAELRALAAHLLHQFGRSALADVIRSGADPHAHTAALMLGVPVNEFVAWKSDGPARAGLFDAARQAAKAINFGVPAGLGVEGLRTYARTAFGVTLTTEEARVRRHRLVHEIYPELAEYLAEDGPGIVARNLHTASEEVRAELNEIPFGAIRKVLAGASGTRHPRPFVSHIWSSLSGLNRNPALVDRLNRRAPNERLAVEVCDAGVATLTGRIRGRVGYTAARNTPFQGLAADGAGLALFELVRAGFRVVAFVHDEVLIELPAKGGSVSASAVERVVEIMRRLMEGVLDGVPAACEYTLGRSWADRGRPEVRGGRIYPASGWTNEPRGAGTVAGERVDNTCATNTRFP